MAPSDVVAAHYEAQARKAESAVVLVRRQWRSVSLADLDGSWARVARRVTIMVASGMLGAAKAGAGYVSDVLDVEPVPVEPAVFAGSASDGRPLDSLLFSAVVRVKTDIAAGVASLDALAAGGDWLEGLTRTQVADAGRGAVGVAIAGTPGAGWVRYVSPPCCQRCAVLAGKFFRWNQGFQRHPRCDCRHTPVLGGARGQRDQTTIGPDQVRDLTQAQRRAVADGADLNQVVNAHRKGLRGSDGMTTSEGTTRRGYASYVRREVDRQRGQSTPETVTRGSGSRNVTRTRPRLTPEAIYRVSASREEAVRLLGLNGYIVGDIRRVAARVA